MKPCEYCGKELPVTAKKNQRFCNRSCTSRWALSQPSIRAKLYTKERQDKINSGRKKWIETEDGWQFRQRASQRMTENNPIKDPRVYRELVIRSRMTHHRPTVLGGNGRGPSKAEWQLMRMFPEGTWNYVIPTRQRRGSGYPTNYKVDLGFPLIKLAIEADGSKHSTPFFRAKDQKKDAFLRGLGWTVLRYKNRAILDFRLQVQILADVEFTISKLSTTQATP